MLYSASLTPSTDWASHRPSAMFFDVGETLIRPRRPYRDLVRETAYKLGFELSIEALNGLGAWMDARVAERTRDRLPFTFPAAESQRFWLETYREYFARFLPGVQSLLLAEELLDSLSSPSGYALFEDTVATLERLQNDGYRLGIISNWEAWLPDLLETFGIEPFFDHIVISGICGFEKPDSDIFTFALDEGGYRPDEVVYIGDNPAHDVEPAQRVGITPILLDRANRYSNNPTCRRIGSLSELPVLVR